MKILQQMVAVSTRTHTRARGALGTGASLARPRSRDGTSGRGNSFSGRERRVAASLADGKDKKHQC